MDARPEARWRARLFAAACGLLLLLEGLLLYGAFHGGELARTIPWDDCSILDTALFRLWIAGQGDSLLGLVMRAQDLAPHSPVADIQALLGYLLSGGRIWGPYVLNAAPLVFGLWLAWPILTRRTPLVLAPLLLALIFHPVTIYSLLNLKADWKGGFFIALSMYAYVQAVRTMSRRDWLIASGLMGAAVLCKLTAFYMPPLALLALGYFELIAATSQAKRSSADAPSGLAAAFRLLIGRWRDIALEAALVAGPLALFFLYGSHSHFNTILYIKDALSSTWTDGLSTLERAAYYSPPSNPAWGPLTWLFPTLFVISTLVSVRRRDSLAWQPLLLGLPTFALFAAPLILAKTSNIEFGGLLVGVALGVTLALAADAASEGPRLAAVVGALAIAACFFSTLESYRAPLTSAQVRDQDQAVAAYDSIVDRIIALRPRKDIEIDVYYEDLIYPTPNIALTYYTKTGDRLNFNRIDRLSGSLSGTKTGHVDFTLVASPDPGTPTVGYQPDRNFWTTKNSAQTHAFVAALPGQRLVGSYPWKGGRIELYQSTPIAPTTPSP